MKDIIIMSMMITGVLLGIAAYRELPDTSGPRVVATPPSAPRGVEIKVTVGMDNPFPFDGMLADWWVIGYDVSRGEWWCCVPPLGEWVPLFDRRPIPRYQGPLERTPQVVVSNSPTHEEGDYIIFFGVDEMDGLLNTEAIWYASTRFTVTPYKGE